MSTFLQDLASVRQKALVDLESQETRRGIEAFCADVLESIAAMKEGIYNEFRRLVAAKPKHRQFHVHRTTYTYTRELTQGLQKVFQFPEERQVLLQKVKALFPDFTVTLKDTMGHKMCQCKREYYRYGGLKPNHETHDGICFVFTVNIGK